MNQVNGHDPCGGNCAACASENRLRLLAEKLNNRGLETHFDTCDSRTNNGHYDSLTVTNPRQPERGSFHVEGDGCVTWDCPVARLDDDGIGRIVDEAINALRANGTRLPRRQVKEP